MGFSESIVIRTSPAAAFAYLGDPANATTLDEALISYEPDTIPMKAGTTNRMRFRAFGLRLTMATRVREWVEGERMVIETLNPSRPFIATATHVFEPLEDGVRYTWAMDFRSTFPGGSLFAAIASRFMRRAASRQQLRFKAIMETMRQP